jgi:hypothetical protein
MAIALRETAPPETFSVSASTIQSIFEFARPMGHHEDEARWPS